VNEQQKERFEDKAARDKVESAIEAIVMKYTNGRGELLASEGQIAYSIAEALPELVALAQQAQPRMPTSEMIARSHWDYCSDPQPQTCCAPPGGCVCWCHKVDNQEITQIMRDVR
jgi:hypothetical protein